MGLGEELGWRGVLQPAMEFETKSFFRTCLFIGVIWSTWHLPINLSGYNDSLHPLWSTFVFFPFYVIGHVFAYGWLTKKSGSVWPAAIAHMSNNSIQSGQIMKADSWLSEQIVTIIGMTITVGIIFYLYGKTKKIILKPPTLN